MRTAISYGSLNLLILGGAAAACVGLLWAASQPIPVPLRVLAGLGFAFTGNTMFALLHEAVHGNFHPRKSVNEAAGRIAAAFFPTAFSLQRAFHLAHHRNNRSDIERFDYYDGTQSLVLKILQWYCILTGLYWFTPPLFALAYALTAEIIPWPRLFGRGNTFGDQTSSRAFLESIRGIPLSRVRMDVAVTIAVQALIFWALGVNVLGWCLCYGLFAITWSSLQYADHAFSELDRERGAWNLKVSPFVRTLFLNYHYHLAHHLNPAVRWRDLPLGEGAGKPALPFLRVLLCMWAGPRPLPGPGCEHGSAIRNLVINLMLGIAFSAIFWILYGSAAVITSGNALPIDVTLPGEGAIPFVPWASPVYLSAVVMFWVAPFLLRRPESFLPLAVTMAFEVLICWWIYVLFPLPAPSHVIPPDGMAGIFFRISDAVNLDGNLLPSLHVALSSSIAIAVGRENGPPLRWAMWLWALAIAFSTVLIRQHFVLDAVSGFALAWASMRWLHPFLIRQLREGYRELRLEYRGMNDNG